MNSSSIAQGGRGAHCVHSCFLDLCTYEGTSENAATIENNLLNLSFLEGLNLNQMYLLSIFGAEKAGKVNLDKSISLEKLLHGT